MNSQSYNSRHRPPRRGAVLVAVILGMTALLLLFGTMLKITSLARREQRNSLRQHQAMWLAESGLARGIARLSTDANYRGETWQVPADELPGQEPGVVKIQVEPFADNSPRRLVRATASYPEQAFERVQITLETDWN